MDTASVTIAGKVFTLPMPYEEGHELSAGEANALNQLFHENVRNNLASKVKAGEIDQEGVSAYAQEYKFGEGRKLDPIEAESISIALTAVKNKIRAGGGKLTEYTAAQLRELAERAIEQNPQIVDLAKKRVKEQQELGQLIMS